MNLRFAEYRLVRGQLKADLTMQNICFFRPRFTELLCKIGGSIILILLDVYMMQ